MGKKKLNFSSIRPAYPDCAVSSILSSFNNYLVLCPTTGSPDPHQYARHGHEGFNFAEPSCLLAAWLRRGWPTIILDPSQKMIYGWFRPKKILTLNLHRYVCQSRAGFKQSACGVTYWTAGSDGYFQQGWSNSVNKLINLDEIYMTCFCCLLQRVATEHYDFLCGWNKPL